MPSYGRRTAWLCASWRILAWTLRCCIRCLREPRGSRKAQGLQAEEEGTPVLNKYGRDLTRQAKNGELDPVIGRENEIQRIIQILSRRTKNNPVLIGDPGVGKSAIIEGLAQRIASGNIPEPLKNKRVVSLDLGGMVAGTKYRGDFEERIKAALRRGHRKSGDVHYSFIDELHTIVGAGSASEGCTDAANILKPASGPRRAAGDRRYHP